MIEPPRPGVKYKAEQMAAMRAAYPDFVMPGYVLRVEADGGFEFVHWTKATAGGIRNEDGTDAQPLHGFTVTPTEPLKAPPIRKRTPQQRLESLANRWAPSMQESGGVPGLTPEQVTEVVGRAWKRGEPVARSQVEEFAAGMLQKAENRQEATEHKKVTRTAPSD